MNKKIIISSVVVITLSIITAYGLITWNTPVNKTNPPEQANEQTDNTQNNQQTESEVLPQEEKNDFNKELYSLSDPNSIWVIVNKQRPLNPTDFVPPNLVVPDVALRLSPSAEQSQISQQANDAVKNLFEAAKNAGFNLQFGSGYRSYAYQKQLYDGYVAQMGQVEADKISARPGTSEHQTGLAFDVTLPSGECFLETCLGAMPEGEWIAANAYKYGWIVRYPEGKEDITGYSYEPWHLRYVDTELATEMHEQNIQTLEEFFSI